MTAMWPRLLLVIATSALISSCALVPKNRRGQLADPTMDPSAETLRERAHAKLHAVREAAAGGDGEPAGGGCGCSN
jgi:Domain of unknown function (DUF4266)